MKKKTLYIIFSVLILLMFIVVIALISNKGTREEEFTDNTILQNSELSNVAGDNVIEISSNEQDVASEENIIADNGDYDGDGKYDADVDLLQELISEQRELGAWVGDDMNNSKEYEWEKGRLVAIKWVNRGLQG